MLKITLKKYDGVIIFSLNGELIFNETKEAENIFLEQIKRESKVVGLDCEKLQTLDSSGLGVFIKLSQVAIKSNIELIFLNVSERITTLFDVSKLDHFFEIMSYPNFEKMYLQ